MKLICNNTCRPFGVKTLTRAFEIICGRLGISDYDRTVYLSFQDLGHPANEGAMSQIDVDQRLITPATDRFEIVLKYGMKFFRTIAVFAHELVHVKQYITGELSQRINWSKLERVETYMGCDASGIPYSQQPWEKEAFAKMDGLAEVAIRKMLDEGVIVRK